MPVKTGRQAPERVGGYELIERLGSGGICAVYKGRDQATGELVAVKVLPPAVAADATLLKRFEREFRAARKLRHPNIVRAVQFGREGETPYLVLEYVDGESLGARLERDGRLPEAEAIRLVTPIARALHAAHQQGIIHRDVKPDNILLSAEGEPKLADLGLAKLLEGGADLTRPHTGLGTPNFMPPSSSATPSTRTRVATSTRWRPRCMSC